MLPLISYTMMKWNAVYIVDYCVYITDVTDISISGLIIMNA